ncbi:unnamed protein product [Lactuca virosa]|uniref:Uncharacterized protein n=1 Tax=Lactuca virosa TaxID=75947 RepID=A0AAU9MX42_9ASTR|nr:unnamed protein product [Lactuca virosa]
MNSFNYADRSGRLIASAVHDSKAHFAKTIKESRESTLTRDKYKNPKKIKTLICRESALLSQQNLTKVRRSLLQLDWRCTSPIYTICVCCD